VPPVTGQVYAPYPGGGRVTQLGLLHPQGLETFGFFRPGPVPVNESSRRPLLVLFHSYNGDGDLELELLTRFSNEADLRHWYILAPDQDTVSIGTPFRRKTYAGVDSQELLRITMNWVLENHPIDSQRIYGVGFSMGGGDLLGFAAQHLDPTKGAFAAVAPNAGTMCLTEEYWRNQSSRDALRAAVGAGAAPNASNRFGYERSSALLYEDPFGVSMLDLGAPQHILNLRPSTPVQAWYQAQEPSPQILTFVDDLELLLGPSTSGGAFERREQVGLPQTFPHSWDTYDYPAVCDWLATKTLTVPRTALVTVGRDARYWDLDVVRLDPSSWGQVRFDFSRTQVFGTTPEVRISDCDNIDSVRMNGAQYGLGLFGQTYEAVLQGNSNAPARFEIKGVPAPQAVFRNGFNVTQETNPRWSYNASTATLQLVSTLGVAETWRMQ